MSVPVSSNDTPIQNSVDGTSVQPSRGAGIPSLDCNPHEHAHNTSDEVGSRETSGVNTDRPWPSALSETPNTDKLNILTKGYLSDVNHVFPLFSEDTVLRQTVYGPHSQSVFWHACLSAIHSCACYRQYITGTTSASFGQTDAAKHLQTALSVVDQLILGEPTLQSIQALACMVLCIHHQRPGEESGPGNLLAAAVRMAFSLRLHRLDEASGISNEERFEKLRVFWCLYILDSEMSMRTLNPSLIHQSDLHVLEPKKVSDDRRGLAVSLNLKYTLNLFAARQRLARISKTIWEKMHTFQGQFQRESLRTESVDAMNGLLAAWKTEWFVYGQTMDFSNQWPSNSMLPIVKLQFDYFLCLMRANPSLPSNAIEVKAVLERGSGGTNLAGRLDEAFVLPIQCIDAARDALQIGTSIRWVRLAHLW